MGANRYSTEQIIVKLREAEIEMGRGLKVPEVCRKLGIAEQTFYRWRKRYGGLDRNEVRRLKALEQSTPATVDLVRVEPRVTLASHSGGLKLAQMREQERRSRVESTHL